MTPNEYAARLIEVRAIPADVGGGWCVVVAGKRLYPEWKSREEAEAFAETYRKRFVYAIEACAQDAVATALQRGMGESPVSDEDMARIRALPESHAFAVDRKMLGMAYGVEQDAWRYLPDLLALVDHLKARLAHMATDNGYADGYAAGIKEGKRRCKEAMEGVVAEVWAYTEGSQSWAVDRACDAIDGVRE